MRSHLLVLLFSILLTVNSLASSAFAQLAGAAHSSESSRSTQIAPLPPIDFSSSMISMAKGLAICIALLFTAVWVLKKLKSPIVTGQGRQLRIIERLPVSTKSSILLVEVNKKKILIGVGGDPVNLISDFVDSDALGDSLDEVKSIAKND